MRRVFLAAALAASAMSGASVSSADVGLSVDVGEPGFYGRISIGDYPRPEVIYSRPIYFEREAIERPPVYLHVPPGYERHWRSHCHEFRACGERVYFVRDDWYEHEYAPRYRERHHRHHDHEHFDHRRHEGHRHG